MGVSGEPVQVGARPPGPRVIGHRGWPARHPDNTLAGIGEALAAVGMAEVDVRRSADGELLLSHDPALGGLVVADTPWAVLAEVDLGGGRAPVLLDDLLAAFPTDPLNLEVKNDPGEPGHEPDHRIALDTAGRARPGDLLSSFWWPSMDAVREAFPSVSTGLLFEEDVAMTAAIEHALGRGHRAVIPRFTVLLSDRGSISLARSAGLDVVTWTVNDPGVARDLAAAGVTAIITDDPGTIAAALAIRETP